MTIDDLRRALDDPGVIASIVDSYVGLYSLGITLDGAGRPAIYFRPYEQIPSHPAFVTIGGEQVSLVTKLSPPSMTLPITSIVPMPPPAAPTLEQLRTRPLFCGQIIQNVSDDARLMRLGITPSFGTLGGFVRLSDNRAAILSASHVIAESGQKCVDKFDRVQQPRDNKKNDGDLVATVVGFTPRIQSPIPARPQLPNTVTYNEADAAVAVLDDKMIWRQEFHPNRQLQPPQGIADPEIGDRVFKVGATGTQLTLGTIIATDVIVAMPMITGTIWMRRSFVVRADAGRFAAHGDSGALVIHHATGMAVGLLYGENDGDGYAAPLQLVLDALGCTLAPPGDGFP
jgi:hypothetical protein